MFGATDAPPIINGSWATCEFALIQQAEATQKTKTLLTIFFIKFRFKTAESIEAILRCQIQPALNHSPNNLD